MLVQSFPLIQIELKRFVKKKKINFKRNLIEVIGSVKPISMKLDTKKLVNNFNFKFT